MDVYRRGVNGRKFLTPTPKMVFKISYGKYCKKTVFLMLNSQRKTYLEKLAIKVGEDMITQESHTKLLGLKIKESQKWNVHCKELISALNSRLYQIRRIKNQVPERCIMRILQSL